MANRVVFGILTGQPMSSEESGRQFLTVLQSIAPDLMPQKYGDTEPIRRQFCFSKIDDALQLWKDVFLWRRKKPKLLGRYWAGTNHGIHDVVYISIESCQLDIQLLINVLFEESRAFNATIGYIHKTYNEEKNDLEFYKKSVMPFNQGLTTYDLRKGLPGICWAMFFGEPYITLFGRELLLTSPAFKTKELSNGIYLQLTDNIDVSEKEYVEFNSIRNEVIRHLNNSAFAYLGDTEKRIPEFRIGRV